MSKPILSFLVLDYNKPNETLLALESIKKNAKFEHQIILLSNGGRQDYIFQYYMDGLIDHVIFNKENNGLGYGTEDLFRFCDTEWAIYFQNDQTLEIPIDENLIKRMIDYFSQDPKLGAIGLAGHPCGHNTYSERAHLINVPFYNKIPKTHGGCGPFNHLKYNEQAVQEYFKENGYKFMSTSPVFVSDKGFYTIRELPDGAVVRMRTDTKSVIWQKLPTKEYMFPDMTPEEWRDSIAGKWVDGTVPSRYLERKESFNCWGNIEN